MTQYIGIDISKAKLDLAWLKDIEKPKVKTKVFKNDSTDFLKLIDWLKSNVTEDLSDIHIILEATGVYHENIAYYLYDQGLSVSIVNPAFVRSYADSLGSRHKTDKQDSILLARYAHSAKPNLWTPPPAEARHLKSLLSRLDALQQDLMREQNRQEKADATDTAVIVKTSIEQMISALKEAIANLNDDIDTHIEDHPNLKQDQVLLQTIKGVGPATSRQMLSLMHNKSFTKASQAAAFLGLIPKQVQSGQFRGKTRLAKNGSSAIRAKLYMAAVVSTRWNPDIKAQYERLLANGKCKMQAICAAMRKLVHICFGVLKHQMPYQPQIAKTAA
ncbi:IS110 family transposase [Psychrobacter sp. LV10R520-6]|uniref:IS110 family transposase n=1 Tax=Psychrobacter sp. LV10R520-6 TaxID=1415574 RepID=UPI0024C868C0|nr:IS110 family transposase [Psychrobacter sp. LV10R520-6]SNT70231.1 Transposase [Psychrobacter sp. LV10R520-6]SNT70589.1 Transposase [Psychrobacter sp. LV10R520-6]